LQWVVDAYALAFAGLPLTGSFLVADPLRSSRIPVVGGPAIVQQRGHHGRGT
jgi:hypothetical protein